MDLRRRIVILPKSLKVAFKPFQTLTCYVHEYKEPHVSVDFLFVEMEKANCFAFERNGTGGVMPKASEPGRQALMSVSELATWHVDSAHLHNSRHKGPVYPVFCVFSDEILGYELSV